MRFLPSFIFNIFEASHPFLFYCKCCERQKQLFRNQAGEYIPNFVTLKSWKSFCRSFLSVISHMKNQLHSFAKQSPLQNKEWLNLKSCYSLWNVILFLRQSSIKLDSLTNLFTNFLNKHNFLIWKIQAILAAIKDGVVRLNVWNFF